MDSIMQVQFTAIPPHGEGGIIVWTLGFFLLHVRAVNKVPFIRKHHVDYPANKVMPWDQE